MSNLCPRDADIKELQSSVIAIEKSLTDGRNVMNSLKLGQEKHEEHIIKLLDQMAELHQVYAKNTENEKSRFENLMVITESNSAHIGQVNSALEVLTRDTAGLVATWEAGEGIVRFANVLGRFGKWVASIAFIGAAYVWLKNNI